MLSAKALDLFLEELMKSTAEIAVAHGAKTVSAGHLKACIAANEKFDFLQEIVKGCPTCPWRRQSGLILRSRSSASDQRVGPPAGPVAGSLDDDDLWSSSSDEGHASRATGDVGRRRRTPSRQGLDEPAPGSSTSQHRLPRRHRLRRHRHRWSTDGTGGDDLVPAPPMVGGGRSI